MLFFTGIFAKPYLDRSNFNMDTLRIVTCIKEDSYFMDQKALFNISYGVFVLGAKTEEKVNACITNTFVQVASDPLRVTIACLNRNYTCGIIKKSGTFSISVLDQSCTFDTIKHFGFQSGRDVNKFDTVAYDTDAYGNPYVKKEACSLFSCKVLSSQDLGTHTLFIAEIEDARVVSNKPPLTYSDYQTKVKPKREAAATDKKIVGWRCKICGYEYKETVLPPDYVCPLCGHPASDFEPIYAD